MLETVQDKPMVSMERKNQVAVVRSIRVSSVPMTLSDPRRRAPILFDQQRSNSHVGNGVL